MAERFQFARADGHPDWSVGNVDFDHVYDNVYDLLRFHRGARFKIGERTGGTTLWGPLRKLRDVRALLSPRISQAALDTVFVIQSQQDSYAQLMRRHLVELDKGLLVIAHEKNRIGTPYVFGVTDCSWLTMFSYGLEGVELPHNAHLQHLDSQVIAITRSQIKPGDLLFHHDDDHVSTYLDDQLGGRVVDTEPHDTTAPSGWPTATLGIGVQVRPMSGNYYCSWSWVNGIGRIRAINGAP